MRIALVIAVAACSSSTPKPRSPSAPLPAWSEQTFDANVQAKLTERFPGQQIENAGGDEFHVGQTLVRFTKAHDACRQDWSQCEAAVEHTLDAVAEAKDAAPVGRAQLRVILRANAKIEQARKLAKLTAQPFSSDAQWLLAADSPNAIRYDVTPESLGMSADEAWRVALENTKPQNLVTATASGVIVYQHDYAPSALRFPALMEETARKVLAGKTGTLLAVCPEENLVLYTIGGAREAAALHDAAEAGSAKSTIPLSTRVMEWRDGNWREAR